MALEELVKQNINTKLSYMPDSFNQQQHHALELFKQRLFLEKTIDEAISFNKSLVFPNENKNLHITTTAEDLIDVFKLRSDVYTSINYQDEFPDIIEGLNFDKYDNHSAIFFYRNNGIVTGTIRVISDFYKKFPSEDKFSCDFLREEYSSVVEISRIIIQKETKGLNLEFKYLVRGHYYFLINNDIDITIFSIKKEHYKLYSKFGGITILKELDTYGTFDMTCLVISWDTSKVSKFFKRAFLS